MFILLTVAVFLITAIVLLILNFAAPNFRYNWLIAAGGAFLAWISVFAWQAQMPLSIQFPAWHPGGCRR
jgi:threonine/homoserine/homoserine lactone efflux protein